MPVLETLGGALFGAVLQVLFDKMDSRQVLDYFRGRKLNEKLLKRLKVKLVSINAVIDDAEQKQFSNSYVKAWLDEVKDAVFDAEDVLDEVDYEFCKWVSEAESQTSSSQVRNFDREIESRMEQVLDDLEFLSTQKGDLGLKSASGVGVGVGFGFGLGSNVSQKLPSSSLVVESVIYGRDDDKEIIFNWLTSDIDNHKQLSILSIVGMGGMGKTTLAQHVYNDPRIEEAKFDIKAWVCVSHVFDVLTVTRAILNAITMSKDDSEDLEILHGRLKEKLKGKRFLLVLDDVWNEHGDKWEAVQTPLNYGGQGSRILVTTRSQKVASTVQSNEVHHLKELQSDYCWQVFAKHGFKNDNGELNAELKEIGMKIVEKCKGLPLALKTIGSLLRTKSSFSEWESVLMSKIWDLPEEDSKIIPALLLSYYHLPPHLKRCFAYCALLPKDHEFYKESLILLWMAENVLKCSHGSMHPEEIGEQYFNDLLSRSFFQQSSKQTHFLMHDLMIDLAKYVCGDLCFMLGVDNPKNIPKVRHFSFVPEYHQCCDGYDSLYYAKRLRTFMPITRKRWACKISVHDLISKFKFLRVLSLSYCFLKEVPKSVGNLKHLRSLDLSHTLIVELPDSTCLLYNLQVLKLNFCENLEELPSNLHKLTELRYLEFMETKVRKVPRLLGKLKNLQVLSSFYVGQSSEFSIQQLGELNLHGSLSIGELQNIVNPSDALAADLINRTHLLELKLKWNLKRNPDDSSKERKVLENLQPSTNLEKLSITNYGGTKFPSWLSSDSLSKVVSLRLEKCKYCIRLPPFGVLPFLKKLSIKGLDGIMSIKADFYGSGSSSFTSLETLKFYHMKEWEEWECKDVTGIFPRLQHLSIRKCPKLKGHLPEQLFHLNYLTIHGCKQLKASSLSAPEICKLNLGDCGKLQIDRPTTLKELTITGHNMEASLLERIGRIYSCENKNITMNCCYNFLVKLNIDDGCDSLTTFPLDFFPKLCQLELRCHNLQMISQGQTHNHLKDLRIRKCPQFESFPSEGLSASFLEILVIEGLENLKSLPKGMHILLPSLTCLKIHDCPQVELFYDGGFPSNLKRMHLSNCSKLIASMKRTFGVNPSLVSLYIGKVDVASFPDVDLLPLSLTGLSIYDCPNLKKLDYKGLYQLCSLMVLAIKNCPNLKCLPEEGLPKSISTLQIWNPCPLLKQRCQKPEGKDWGKIAHIQNVWVDDKWIN